MPKFAIPHSFFQRTKKGFPIKMITKDFFFPVPPAQDVVSGARVLDSRFASHSTHSAHKKGGASNVYRIYTLTPFSLVPDLELNIVAA